MYYAPSPALPSCITKRILGWCRLAARTTRGVPYGELLLDEIDWSEVGDHDPGRRAERKGSGETNVPVEWATEACQDLHRWVRSAGSSSGLTVRVTGYSSGASFVVTVIVAPKDHPPAGRWWGATA